MLLDDESELIESAKRLFEFALANRNLVYTLFLNECIAIPLGRTIWIPLTPYSLNFEHPDQMLKHIDKTVPLLLTCASNQYRRLLFLSQDFVLKTNIS